VTVRFNYDKDSRRAIAVSRVVSLLLFVVTLGIFWAGGQDDRRIGSPA
jgi:hypothetical protein